jgi:hypothetical protein
MTGTAPCQPMFITFAASEVCVLWCVSPAPPCACTSECTARLCQENASACTFACITCLLRLADTRCLFARCAFARTHVCVCSHVDKCDWCIHVGICMHICLWYTHRSGCVRLRRHATAHPAIDIEAERPRDRLRRQHAHHSLRVHVSATLCFMWPCVCTRSLARA